MERIVWKTKSVVQGIREGFPGRRDVDTSDPKEGKLKRTKGVVEKLHHPCECVCGESKCV